MLSFVWSSASWQAKHALLAPRSAAVLNQLVGSEGVQQAREAVVVPGVALLLLLVPLLLHPPHPPAHSTKWHLPVDLPAAGAHLDCCCL